MVKRLQNKLNLVKYLNKRVRYTVYSLLYKFNNLTMPVPVQSVNCSNRRKNSLNA